MPRAHTDDSYAADAGTDEMAAESSRLLADLDRWQAELERYSLTRLTLWAGVYAKAFKSFEVLVACATGHWVSVARQPGHAVATDVARRKSADRLTVGQRVEILRRLGTLGLIGNQDRARWQADLDLLGRLVRKRNDFAHGRFGFDDREVAAVQALFVDLRALCDSPIIMINPSGSS